MQLVQDRRLTERDLADLARRIRKAR